MDQNFSLSNDELNIMADAELLHTKNKIINMVISRFADISNTYVFNAKTWLPVELIEFSPKISRGEQYMGLPYVMLDYPRNFSREHTLAIRTFFWWGNFFSIHLQLTGSFKQQYISNIKTHNKTLKTEDWFIGVSDDAWCHHFGNNNYMPVKNKEQLNDLDNMPVIKLAKKIPLTQWDQIDVILINNFNKLINILKG